MSFNPLEWFRAEASGTNREPLKKLAAGLVVWVLAWLVVWWNQDAQATARAQLSARQKSGVAVLTEQSNDPNNSPKKVPEIVGSPSQGSPRGSLLSWLGTLVGMGLFWGGGVLVFRPLISRGFMQAWLVRCGTVERLALATAAALTLLAIVSHSLYSIIEAWMLAALIGLLVLAAAFGWKLPGAKRS